MKKLMALLFLCVLLGIAPVAGAAVATFDDLTLSSESYWNGSDGSGGFTSGDATFTNTYNTSWSSWDGWSYSNTTDTTTPGFLNQYSAITGGGASGSENYGVFYEPWSPGQTVSFTAPVDMTGAHFTNTTYAYLSMQDGDSFAKKFGGTSGDDADWFKLEIQGLDTLGASTGTVDFYLADYRFSDNSQDYIVDEWTWVDLSGLGTVSGLAFDLTSSDNHPEYGMNTPAYFAMDNLNAVPVPAAVWLLASGLIGLVGIRRRK